VKRNDFFSFEKEERSTAASAVLPIIQLTQHRTKILRQRGFEQFSGCNLLCCPRRAVVRWLVWFVLQVSRLASQPTVFFSSQIKSTLLVINH
jgi:hypothetical protein